MEAYNPEDPVTKRVNAFGIKFGNSPVKIPKNFIETLIDAAYPVTDPLLFGRRPDKAGLIAQMRLVAWSIQKSVMVITRLVKWWTIFVVGWGPFVKHYGPLPEIMWEVVEQTLQG